MGRIWVLVGVPVVCCGVAGLWAVGGGDGGAERAARELSRSIVQAERRHRPAPEEAGVQPATGPLQLQRGGEDRRDRAAPPREASPSAPEGQGADEEANLTQLTQDVVRAKDEAAGVLQAASVKMLRVVNRERDVASEADDSAEQKKGCPPEPPQLRRKNACVNCGKYRGYVHRCNATGTLFMNVKLPSFVNVMDSIARWARLGPGMKVLDWGAGCGTKMNYWKQKYGVHGVGLDYTWDTVRWARQHRADGVSYCWADGSRALKYFETNSFDRVVSHSALYHVMPVGTQCKVVREAVRVVKPGGIVWFGHMRSGPAIKFWKKGPWRVCPMDPSWNVTSHVHRDKRVFGGSESWYITPAAISIILFKGMPPAGAGPALNTTIPAVQSDLDSSDSQDSSAGQG